MSESAARAVSRKRTSLPAIITILDICSNYRSSPCRGLVKVRTCLSSIFPVSISNRRILTPSLPCFSLVTDSNTYLRKRRPIISNSTWTFDDVNETKEAAFPAGVGLSPQESIPRYSFMHVVLEGLFSARISPRARFSSPESCIMILGRDTGTESRQGQELKM